MIAKKSLQRFSWLPLLLVSVYLLFVAKLDYYSPRSWRAAWDLGHVVIFIPAVFLLYRYSPRLSKMKMPSQVALILALVFVIGGGIELLQGKMNRSAGMDDVMFDLAGACIAMLLFSPRFKYLTWKKRIVLYSVIPGLLLISAWQLITSLIDEYQARRDFPLLSGLEHRYESSRWSGKTQLSTSRDIKKSGCCSLQFKMASGQYAGVKLQHFSTDWSAYRTLEMALYNPLGETQLVLISIYDSSYQKIKLNFPGLYTRRFVLQPGWNTISFDYFKGTDNISSAQTSKKEVRGLAVFVHRPVQGQTIYIDDVRLVK